MNVADYFDSVRAAARELPEGDALVTSLNTKDGGKAGVVSEVARETAAKMIVDGRARVATSEEAKAHRQRQQEGLRRAADALLLSQRRSALINDSAWAEAIEPGKGK